MPKIKTHSSSKKRFRISANGKVKMSHAYRRHRLVTKARKVKKKHKLGLYASDADAATIKRLIPYN